MGYYGVIQTIDGADHVYVYTEDQIKKNLLKKKVDIGILPGSNGEKIKTDIGWPKSVEVSSTIIEKLDTKEDAKDFLSWDVFGPESDDPTLEEIDKYYCTIETEEGSATDIIKEFSLDMRELGTSKYIYSVKEEIDWLLELKQGLSGEDCKDILFSEAMTMGPLPYALASDKRTPEFKLSGLDLEGYIKIPDSVELELTGVKLREPVASEIVRISDLPLEERDDAKDNIYFRIVFFEMIKGGSTCDFGLAKIKDGKITPFCIKLNSESAKNTYKRLMYNFVSYIGRKLDEGESMGDLGEIPKFAD